MKNIQNPYPFFALLFLICITIGCSSCGGVKKVKEVTASLALTDSITHRLEQTNKPSYQTPSESSPKITIQRKAFGKEISFEIDPMHKGGEAWSTVWEETVKDEVFERMNRVCQLSPTVVSYRRFPKEVSKDFYYIDQPEFIEFLDSNQQTIKTIDIWRDRPYQDMDGKRLTYHHFNAEAFKVLAKRDQSLELVPNEYTLHTYIISEGNHIIVNYQLRSLLTKSDTMNGTDIYEFGNIIGVKHTIKIYDLKGNLKHELKDMPSVDQAVVSNNGQYMMFTFGGDFASTGSPFGSLDRTGWALMRLSDEAIVYQEYTDDGDLAFNGLIIEQGYLRLAYSTPRENDGYFDYHVFFDENKQLILKKKWLHSEWKQLLIEFSQTKVFRWEVYLNKYNFDKIQIN